MDPNLMCTFFGKNFLILIMVRTLENNYFLMRTKLGYLRYILSKEINVSILRKTKINYYGNLKNFDNKNR